MTADAQRALDLAPPPGDADAHFVFGPSSAQAFALLGAWTAWPGGALALVGPPGSGKTRIARIWSARVGASWVDAADPAASANAAGPRIFDNADAAVLREGGERALFALIEHARAGAGPILFTARRQPREWTDGLADLRSRLEALPSVSILDPTDEEMREALFSGFRARGLTVDDHVTEYLVRRIERSFAAASAVIADLDRRALEGKRRVTRRLAQELFHGDNDEPREQPSAHPG